MPCRVPALEPGFFDGYPLLEPGELRELEADPASSEQSEQCLLVSCSHGLCRRFELQARPLVGPPARSDLD